MIVSLGLPTRGTVQVETMQCIIQSLRELPYEVHLNFHKGTYIHELRNDIVREARKVGAHFLMFIDSDVVFPPYGIRNLISQNKDVIGAMYNMKVLPPLNTIKMLDPDGKRATSVIIPEQTFKAYGIPTGFMCIKMESIADMEFPFGFDREPDGGLVGEDILFCMKVQEKGKEVWCDPNIKVGHIGDYVY